ncbi:hypothetical protein [Actinomadura harenae]|uniref:Serine/threonine protein kinase n=1 Tax=Actinomadura harenae TaxID=2483351 RepID=A0A3M2M5T2_9ACTN|nr:hypothetical protein [Actinomadura harenae]RMI45124.1 hypothetical protein EBO15_11195 [Actinomadura harenae]
MLRPIAATALILALATACGGGGDSGGGDGGSGTDRAAGTAQAPSSGPGQAPGGSSSAPSSQEPSSEPGGGPAGSTPAPSSGVPGAPVTINGVQPGRAAPSSLDGTWASSRVKMFFYRGAAALNSPNFCTGTVDPQNTITLTCADHSTERAQGKAEVSGSSLKVTWASGTVDTLTRKS